MLIGLLGVSTPAFGGNLAREFNIYAPPQPTYERRTSMIVVTAVVGDGHDKDRCPVASGVYFYQLVSDHDINTRKMLLINKIIGSKYYG